MHCWQQACVPRPSGRFGPYTHISYNLSTFASYTHIRYNLELLKLIVLLEKHTHWLPCCQSLAPPAQARGSGCKHTSGGKE